jgi:riboflavin kinase/FMN adenylyltransferase
MVVGENFALGKGRTGNVDRLRAIGEERGFQVEAVPIAQLDGAPVTSTRIRERLAAGDVEAATRLLGRRYDLVGRVVHGEALGRILGVPTANLRLHEEKLLPRLGIYAAWARVEGEDEWRPGALSLGVRPTFGGQTTTLEVHLLDWDGDLYGRELAVEFQAWLREERAFASREALIEAMQEDLAEARLRLVRREPIAAAS